MSLLTRKLVKILHFSSSSSSNTHRLLTHPALVLHHSSSLYSTTRRIYPQKPKPETPSSPSPLPSPSPPPPPPPPETSLRPACTPPFSAAASQPKKYEVADGGGGDHDWPKPSEIPFQAKIANTVNLIGYVKMPVQFQASPDGKFWAGTVISQEATSLSPLLWIPIIFEGDLAHIAACHLKENDYVYIAGQLGADPPPFTIDEGRANVQVHVHCINYVQQSSIKEKMSIPHKQKDQAVSYSVGVKRDGNSALISWRDLLNNPQEWRDHRKDKHSGLLNPKHPDFKRKDGNVALWLNTVPASVLSQVEGLEFDCQIQETKQVRVHKDDNKWKDLVENPSKWWDNRSDKINKRAPDFKHKDTGDALWLSSSPAWVLPKLPPVKPTLSKKHTLLS